MDFEKTVELPSNGLLGGPKEVTLRSMTTKEEKILYSAKDFSFITKLVRSCCKVPEFLDLYKVTPTDIHYLMYALRELTFGATYDQEVFCPYCNSKQVTELDITEFEYTLLDLSELEEKLTLTLPVNKETVTLRILSQGQIDDIEREVKTKVSKGTVKDAESYEYILKLANLLVNVKDANGETVFENIGQTDAVSYINKLHLRDLNAIQNRMSDIKYGLDTTVGRDCQNCGELMEVTGAVCPEFFRPTH